MSQANYIPTKVKCEDISKFPVQALLFEDGFVEPIGVSKNNRGRKKSEFKIPQKSKKKGIEGIFEDLNNYLGVDVLFQNVPNDIVGSAGAYDYIKKQFNAQYNLFRENMIDGGHYNFETLIGDDVKTAKAILIDEENNRYVLQEVGRTAGDNVRFKVCLSVGSGIISSKNRQIIDVAIDKYGFVKDNLTDKVVLKPNVALYHYEENRNRKVA